MKKWIINIEKEYSEEDYDSMIDAENQFIQDIANGNFEFTVEEREETQ